MKNVANDCKVAANKLLTPNTNPWLSLLTHLAISELYYTIIILIWFFNVKFKIKLL